MRNKFKLTTFTLLAACSFLNGATPSPSLALSQIKDPNALISNELARLNILIQATQQSLDSQKKLLDKILEYQKIQDIHFQHPGDNEVLFRMVKSAYQILKIIEDNHLTQTFDPDFIHELTVLSQVAAKRGIPKP